MEIWVSRLHCDTHISSAGSARIPVMTTFVNSIRIETNVYFKVTSGNNSSQDPIVHGIKDKLGSLPKIASNGELRDLIDGHVEILSSVDFLGNIEFVASGHIVFNVDSDEVPARVAGASVDCYQTEFALTYIKCTK